jgi:hypothetical protein
VRPRQLAITAIFASLLACVDDNNSRPGGTVERADAALPDAEPPPDAAVREGLWYVMDAIRVPESSSEATDVALDLDRDGRRDNALGGLLAAMHSAADLPIAAIQTEMVESGRILELVGIDAASLDDAAPIAVTVARGVDLDGDPADNFSGVEGFALDPHEGADGLLNGALVEGRLRAGPGTVPIQLAMFGATPEVVALVGVGARLRALASDEGLAGGRFCGALTEAEVDEVLIPAMAVGVDSIVRRDCPGGPCTPDTQGEDLAPLFDEDEDGTVPLEEFRANALIESTVGNPDLDLFDADGQFNPRMDGIKDALSFCLGFTAAGARAYE